MAAVETPSVVPDVASFLAPADVPTKLRCAICNKLAVNAFRLPCCDQSICESCQSTLPASCPVCEHSPLSAEDCKPNKPLRTTITVFLRTEKKKRELVIEHAESPRPSTPVAVPTLSAPLANLNSSTKSSLKEQEIQLDGPKSGSSTSEEQRQPHSEDKESQNYPPIISNEVIIGLLIPAFVKDKLTPLKHTDGISGPTAPSKNLDRENAEKVLELERQGSEAGAQRPASQEDLKVGIEGQLGQWGTGQGQQQMMGAVGVGFDGSGVGFPNMGWNGPGDFNPMINGMQTVMPSANWGSFSNAMAMPGMNMDPMAMSQGMYGSGFGGQGMSMGGMNMGMGMGFNGGQSGYDGWNGQSTWSGGHDKFNPNANGTNAGGMVGDFGANTGYHPAAGGYNLQSHGNYSQMHQPQYQNNDYQDSFQGQGYLPRGGRGRGRGFSYGARGRGGYGYGYDGNNAPFQQQLPQQYLQQPVDQVHHQHGFGNETNLLPNGTDDTSSLHIVGSVTPKGPMSADGVEYEMSEAKSEAKTLVETIADIAPSETSKQAKEVEMSRVEKNASEPTAAEPEVAAATAADMSKESTAPPAKDFAPPLAPISTYQGEHPQDFAARGRGSNVLRGPFRGGGEFRGNYRGRGGGFWSSSSGVTGHSPNQSIPTSQFPIVTPTEPKPVQGLGVPGAPSAPKALREGFPNRPRGRGGFGTLGRGGFENRGGLAAPAPPVSHRFVAHNPSHPPNLTHRISRIMYRKARNRLHDLNRPPDQDQNLRRVVNPTIADIATGQEASQMRTVIEIKDTKGVAITLVGIGMTRMEKAIVKKIKIFHYILLLSTHDQDLIHQRGKAHTEVAMTRKRSDVTHIDTEIPTDLTVTVAEIAARKAVVGAEDRDRLKISIALSPRDLTRIQRIVTLEQRLTRIDEGLKSPTQAGTTTGGILVASAEDEAEVERRNHNRSSRRAGKADGTSNGSNAAKETDRDRPRELERNDRKNRDRERERDRDRDRDRDTSKTTAIVQEEDPHNREREERNRERLLKEQQRREELNKERQRKDNERKRERVAEDDDFDNDAAGEADEDRHRHRRHKHRHNRRRAMTGDEGGVATTVDGAGANNSKDRQRRMSYKYEDEESDEARAQRVETEREAARWG
ncbi:hypothetical protein FGG08_000972 [Glutinoglossum americanum]|uniref:RING-type domain-containing protein n=1 Tax=Glutinoglossum americanum TaxID=1670608 RepID=A0A9P8I947_9PEZI|nr:hypothetical protein FGG08_000972 [Glutinoglossum americanum]